MRRAILFGLLAFAFTGCASAPAGPGRFTGVWQWGFETSSFTTTLGEGPYWLFAEGDMHQALTAPLREAGGSPWGRVAIVVEGDLSPPGHYGQLGAYRRQLRVTRGIEARLMTVSARRSGN